MATKTKSGRSGTRKYGRNSTKAQRYKLEDRREKNKKRKQLKREKHLEKARKRRERKMFK